MDITSSNLLMAAGARPVAKTPLYLAVAGQNLYGDPFASGNTPFLKIYKKESLGSGSFNYLADLSVPSLLSYSSVKFSPNGQYLAAGGGGSTDTRIQIYKRTGDSFTRLSSLNITSAAVFGVSWSPDSTYLAFTDALTGTSVERLRVLKRSGDSFSSCTVDVQPPNSTAYTCTFSDDGTYVAIGFNVSPYLYIYKRSGDTFTRLASALNSNPVSTALLTMSFLPGAGILAVGGSGTTRINAYSRSADSFTRITSPVNVQPANTVEGMRYSNSGTYLAVSGYGDNNYHIYKRSGNSHTRIYQLTIGQDTTYTFSKNGYSTPWSDPSDKYVAFASNETPFIHIYERSGDVFTKLPNLSTLPTTSGQVNGLDFYYGV